MSVETIAIASDHAGTDLKEKVIDRLKQEGLDVLDLGTNGPESVDYPNYAAEVAGRVSRQEIRRGILVCGTGIGMSITANRFPQVRATLVYDKFTAQMCREHNDSNLLVLGARTLPHELSLELVDIWLKTEFAGDRHQKRLDIISSIEEKISQS